MALAALNSDIVEPPRKRRRPPLSCIQCRHKKIKCDRVTPCGPCIRSKDSNCKYRSNSSISPVAEGASFPTLRRSETTTAERNGYARRMLTPGSTPGTLHPRESVQNRHLSLPPSDQSGTDAEVPRGTLQHRLDLLENAINKISEKAVSEKARRSSNPEKPLRGTLSKTRLFGPSHWMTSVEAFRMVTFPAARSGDMNDSTAAGFFNNSNEIRTILENCKAIARAIKIYDHKLVDSDIDLKESIPIKEISDRLIDLYIDNFESSYRILHIPSFRKEYNQFWTQSSNPGFVIKLLLVLSIGSTLYQEYNETDWRRKSLQWIYAAQRWLTGPFEKSRLNVNGLQIQCLLVLARQVNAVGGDLVFVALGSLVRTSMIMGLHRDPKFFPKVSVLQSEMRRRLWATILEMTVQSALDTGMPPMLEEEDFDTEPPSNLDDDDFDEMTASVEPKSITVYTQSSYQILLRQSFSTRNEVLKLVNNMYEEPSYDQVIRLDKNLEAVYRVVAKTMEKYGSANAYRSDPNEHAPTAFHRNFYSYLCRRFLLALHRTFAIKGRTDPQYYFSRKICLEIALATIYTEPDKDFARLRLRGGGMLREVLTQVAFPIYWELITQVEDDRSQSLLAEHQANREPLHEALREVQSISEQRVLLGENNVKAYVFSCTALSQIEAMEAGRSLDEEILRAGTRALRAAYNMIKSRCPVPLPAATDPVYGSSGPACNLTAEIFKGVDRLNVPEECSGRRLQL